MSKFFKIEILGLENLKILLKKLYFLTAKNKLSTGRYENAMYEVGHKRAW